MAIIAASVRKRIPTKRTNAKTGISKTPPRRLRKSLLLWGVALGVVLTGLFFWNRPNKIASPGSHGHPVSTPSIASGEVLARKYCAMCHLFTEPSYLMRETWLEQVLPEMKARLGLYSEALDGHREATLLKASGAFPATPMISIQEWNLIESYYLSNAPALQPTGRIEKIEVGIPGFDVELSSAPQGSPLTSLTFIDEKHGELLIGDSGGKALNVYDSTPQLRETVPMGNMPVSVWPVESGIYVTSIGSIVPSQIPDGSLSFLPRIDDGYGPPQEILNSLPRATHTALGDLNGDGRDDLVISMFGHVNIGRLSWFEDSGDGNFKEHILRERDGTIQTMLEDMNGDGFLDIVALTAAATETMEIFYNDGKGEFTSNVIFQERPIFALTHFELADFDGDGRKDFIVSNGATGEWYTSPLKSFHGLRIYLNRGEGKFEESFFFRMNGAYQFTIGDFDEDGDVDIAAVSFYPDYRHNSAESFVYLQNQGNLSFRAFTFPEVLAGRWITVHGGDLDGDGDLDLVLGSKFDGPSSVPSVLFNNWKEEGPSFIILRNKLR